MLVLRRRASRLSFCFRGFATSTVPDEGTTASQFKMVSIRLEDIFSPPNKSPPQKTQKIGMIVRYPSGQKRIQSDDDMYKFYARSHHARNKQEKSLDVNTTKNLPSQTSKWTNKVIEDILKISIHSEAEPECLFPRSLQGALPHKIPDSLQSLHEMLPEVPKENPNRFETLYDAIGRLDLGHWADSVEALIESCLPKNTLTESPQSYDPVLKEDHQKTVPGVDFFFGRLLSEIRPARYRLRPKPSLNRLYITNRGILDILSIPNYLLTSKRENQHVALASENGPGQLQDSLQVDRVTLFKLLAGFNNNK